MLPPPLVRFICAGKPISKAPSLPSATRDTAAILAALQQFNSDITTRLDKLDQSIRIATVSPFLQAL